MAPTKELQVDSRQWHLPDIAQSLSYAASALGSARLLKGTSCRVRFLMRDVGEDDMRANLVTCRQVLPSSQ